MDDVFELYWKHFRTQLAGWWDALNEHEVQWVNGKRENLMVLLQAKYGYTPVECENIVRAQIDSFEQRHRTKLGSFNKARRNAPLLLERKSLDAAPLEKIGCFDDCRQTKPMSPKQNRIDDNHRPQKVGTKYDDSV